MIAVSSSAIVLGTLVVPCSVAASDWMQMVFGGVGTWQCEMDNSNKLSNALIDGAVLSVCVFEYATAASRKARARRQPE